MVHGYVLGPLAEPVPTAEVWVEDSYGEIAAKGATDGEGYFVLSGLPRGRDVVVRATAPGLQVGAAQTPQPARARGELAPPSWIRLHEATELSGRILDVERKPIAGATVVGWNTLRGASPEHEAVEVETDAVGVFVHTKLAAGNTTFAVWAEGYLPQRFSVDAEDRRGGDYVVVVGDGPRLRLDVAGVPGSRVDEVEIAFDARGGAGPSPVAYRTGGLAKDGSFASEPFGPGTRFSNLRICAERLGFDRPWVPEVPPKTTVEVAVADLVPIAVETAVVLGGQPCAAQQFEILNGTRGEVVDLRSDASGRFRFEASWLDSDLVQARLVRSSAWLTPGGAWTGRLGEMRGATLTAVRGQSLRIRLLRAGSKEPLPNTAVRADVVRGRLAGLHFDAVTDAQGFAEWFGLRAELEHHRFVVSTPRYQAEAGVEAPSSEPQFVLARPASSLRGCVTDGKGKPVAHCDVWLRTANAWESERQHEVLAATRTDGEGRYCFLGLRYGDHALEVFGAGRARHVTEPFAVGEAAETQQDVSVR